ncbi:Wall-associated receptor kinase [Heracleum sosnowskyi]|uniref:Wall-associated receptor kinase n=1 Tax=Heracleum sosnowskyi TaxID=360622 RepID=A0AAD8JEG2_9APIA|nr:Wall-associated receptor kinase [Heracleum sosnowskyi]
MAIQLVVQLILALVFMQEASAQESSVAKPGCPDRCGSVSINYPFGIGTDCSANERLEISCNTSFNPPKPFLSYNQLEVLQISVLEGTIQVNNPVFKDCTDGSETQKVVYAYYPFTFSVTQNRFTAMGCDNLASMTKVGSNIGGCMSFCNSTGKDNSCFGVNCCQTNIPPSLWFFSTSLKSINPIHDQDMCKYAFIADQDWFLSLTDIYSVQTMEQVPAVLDWKPTVSCYSFGPTNVSRNSSLCGRNTLCTNQHCSCLIGYEGNPYLPDGCQAIGNHNCTETANVKKTPIVIAIATCGGLGVLLVLAITWWLCKVMKRRNIRKLKEKNFERNGGLLLRQQVSSSEGNVDTTKLFTSKELEMATDNYNKDRILGQGGQGTVYKGMLTDGKIVAVKKSKIEHESKLEYFINEVVILSQINHRNVVKLHGCCLEREVPLLVYEFIPNGTLFEYIHDHNEDFPLTWDIRVRVATEIAGALFYLHSAASIPIFHRDIKSTNILLDEKYRAKMADFGTSKSIAIDQTHLTTRVQGTFGYLDPEYFRSSQFTDKSDVYSFGVVLVELLTGLKPILAPSSHKEARSLVAHFILAMEENRMLDIVDSRIATEVRREEITKFASIAYRCLNLNGRNRPTMKQVAVELENINMSHRLPTAEQLCQEVEYPVNGLWELASTSVCSSTNESLKVDIQEQPLIY